jgi:hypothetical protein
MPVAPSRPRQPQTWHLDASIVGPLIRAVRLGTRRSCRKGEYLYRQGEVDTRFYFIVRGRFQISATREDGAEFVLEIMGRWAICGAGSAFDGRPRFPLCRYDLRHLPPRDQ